MIVSNVIWTLVVIAESLDFEDIRDFKTWQLFLACTGVLGIFLVLGLRCFWKSNEKLRTALTSRPFKKCKFKVGERVVVGKKLATVIKNEKSFETEELEIRYEDGEEIEIYSKYVKKATKREQNLK